MAYVNLDIDVDDFLESSDAYELTKIVEWLDDRDVLEEEGFYRDGLNTNGVGNGVQDEMWTEGIEKLHKNRMNLTVEEEEIILKISQKFL